MLAAQFVLGGRLLLDVNWSHRGAIEEFVVAARCRPQVLVLLAERIAYDGHFLQALPNQECVV